MKIVKIMMLTLLIVAGYSFVVCAQISSGDKEIRAVIAGLFEGMSKRDAKKMEESFAREAFLQTVQQTDEGNIVKNTSVTGFLNGLASIPAEVELEERMLDYKINVDGGMASVWAPYEFYVDGKLSHCGVNSFQLVRFPEGWKIVYIIDTRRKEGC